MDFGRAGLGRGAHGCVVHAREVPESILLAQRRLKKALSECHRCDYACLPTTKQSANLLLVWHVHPVWPCISPRWTKVQYRTHKARLMLSAIRAGPDCVLPRTLGQGDSRQTAGRDCAGRFLVCRALQRLVRSPVRSIQKTRMRHNNSFPPQRIL